MCDNTHLQKCDVTHAALLRCGPFALASACVSDTTWHDSFVRVTWLIHMCDTTHLYLWHAMTLSYVWHDSSTLVTWLVHMCAMHSCLWNDAFIRVTWRINMCEMWHAVCNDALSRRWQACVCVCHDSLIHIIWLIYTRNMPHSYMWHGTSRRHAFDTTHTMMRSSADRV